MIRRAHQICPVCENSYLYGAQTQCSGCDDRERLLELENRIEVMELNAVDDLDGLKQWIKEHLIK